MLLGSFELSEGDVQSLENSAGIDDAGVLQRVEPRLDMPPSSLLRIQLFLPIKVSVSQFAGKSTIGQNI